KPGSILVAQAASAIMNPTLSSSFLAAQQEADPEAYRAEYMGEFRDDIAQFVNREAVEACISTGVYERAPLSDLQYFAFVDPSGGSGDSMTLAVAHSEDNVAVLDALREVKPPFSPEAVVSEFVDVLRSYRVSAVRGDRFAGEFAREPFRRLGIEYHVSDKSKSEIYGLLLPLINSRRVDLLDDKRMIAQLCGLERKTARGGRSSIDHGPGAHDDSVNAAAGALVLAGFRPVQEMPIVIPYVVSGGSMPAWARSGPNPFAPSGAIADYYEDKRSCGFRIKD